MMKIAVFADIHSNVFALKAVIDDALDQNIDRMVNLGDILYGPIAPRATYDLLKEHQITTVSGNQDRMLFESSQTDIAANRTLEFILDDLGTEPVDWVKTLPFDRLLNNNIYLCHGSPTSDMEYLLENVETGTPCVKTDREILSSLNGQVSQLILCGHTHIPRTIHTSSGQLIVNPGSVGLPAYTDDEPVRHSMENFSPHASYAIIENNGAGWVVRQIKVAYDYNSAAAAALERGREDWAHFIRTGRGV